jgi:hypothetical protein
MKTIKILMLAVTASLFLTNCDVPNSPTISSSGVKKASTTIETDLNGNTSEQTNIINRLKEDNKPGSIKHLYLISAYSGQVIIYSTVKGKVTSSGKRLTPTTVNSSDGKDAIGVNMNLIEMGDRKLSTNEVLQDDGTYGSSVEYIYWWDSKGIYHQQYITGGMIVHISNEPIAVKSVAINLELNKAE